MSDIYATVIDHDARDIIVSLLKACAHAQTRCVCIVLCYDEAYLHYIVFTYIYHRL